ncbi:hypothetical protein [Bosea sp. 685]|uniref:hypothetical protein n=1 Tax=Bosea sp. 685 TaxID=3080057 RepID=UPI00289327CE|nr:hypothetical protein [Bosea sp. 685]WNJ89617.1 hypothetical protein RMR04_24935 [Bosea sp. 685]
MKMASTQFDLFDDAPGYRQTPRPVQRKRKTEATPAPPGWNDEEAAQRLEQSDRIKILRKLVPRSIIPRAESVFPNLAVLVDKETAVLNHAKDEIIEIGAVAFTYVQAPNHPSQLLIANTAGSSAVRHFRTLEPCPEADLTRPANGPAPDLPNPQGPLPGTAMSSAAGG